MRECFLAVDNNVHTAPLIANKLLFKIISITGKDTQMSELLSESHYRPLLDSSAHMAALLCHV